MAKQMSDKEKARILELYAQGFCRQDIARDLHRAPSSISKFLAKQETLPKVKPRIEPENALKRDRYYTPYYCKGCYYRRNITGSRGSDTYCAYGNMTKKVRGCPVEHCTKYKRR